MDIRDTTPAPHLKIHLFGQFMVFVRGRALPENAIKGRKARSLLKLIALQRQAQVVRDHAMHALWPELDTEAAASQLYKAIHHIRKAFARQSTGATEWLEITDDLILLASPNPLVTDVRIFERFDISSGSACTGLRRRPITSYISRR